MVERLEELEAHASRLAAHIQDIRIDFPEAADARKAELRDLYRRIAQLRRASPTPERGDG